MICVEVPVRTIYAEIGELEHASGEYSQAFARGAKAALEWILTGDNPPSGDAMLLKDSEWDSTE